MDEMRASKASAHVDALACLWWRTVHTPLCMHCSFLSSINSTHALGKARIDLHASKCSGAWRANGTLAQPTAPRRQRDGISRRPSFTPLPAVLALLLILALSWQCRRPQRRLRTCSADLVVPRFNVVGAAAELRCAAWVLPPAAYLHHQLGALASPSSVSSYGTAGERQRRACMQSAPLRRLSILASSRQPRMRVC